MSRRKEKYARYTEGELLRHGQRLRHMEDGIVGLKIDQHIMAESLYTLEQRMNEKIEIRVNREMCRRIRQKRSLAHDILEVAADVLVFGVSLVIVVTLILAVWVAFFQEIEADTLTAAIASTTPSIDVVEYAEHLELITAVAITPVTAAETADDPYILEAVPISAVYQITMQEACSQYNCPYSLALAVAEVESNFNMDAVGGVGEIGIMQLNPGPGNGYFEELTQDIGMDPAEYTGNITGACYILGRDLASYDGDVGKVAMSYNMGRTGAANAWASGIYSTEYSEAVLEAAEKWENIISTETSGIKRICGG